MGRPLGCSAGLSEAYAALWKCVIRPQRDQYLPAELGTSTFLIQDKIYERRDLQLVNDRGYKLECSHFVPCFRSGEKLPCVVFLHGSNSSRLEAFELRRVLLPRDVTVFCFDFSGSGRSEGEYISLGYYEQQDIRVVLEHLRTSGSVSSIGLWGRSMGAVAAILSAASSCKDGADELPRIAACVLDSPFSNFRQLARELAGGRTLRVPRLLQGLVLRTLRREVQMRHNFDINALDPILFAPKARMPALFAVAKDDDFVGPHHSQALFRAWGGKDRSYLVTVPGNHNDTRPAWFLDEAAEFMHERLVEAAAKGTIAGPSLEGASPSRTGLLTQPAASLSSSYSTAVGQSSNSSPTGHGEGAEWPPEVVECEDADAIATREETESPSRPLASLEASPGSSCFTPQVATPSVKAGTRARSSPPAVRLLARAASAGTLSDRSGSPETPESPLALRASTLLSEQLWPPAAAAVGSPLARPLGERLRRFRSLPRLKQAALLVIAGWAPGDEQGRDEDGGGVGGGSIGGVPANPSVAALRDIFMALDGDGDGLLTEEELRRGLELSGIADIPGDFREFIGEFTNGAFFDYTELLAASLDDEEDCQDEDVCRATFEVFDQDRDGQLSAVELGGVLCGWNPKPNTLQYGKALQDLPSSERRSFWGIHMEGKALDPDIDMDMALDVGPDPDLPPEQLAEVAAELRDIDLNGDGAIDFQEFLVMMRGKAKDDFKI